MQIEQKLLIDELLTLTEKSIASAKKFKTLSATELNFRNGPNEWSVLECIEHLNLYGDFYIPEIENKLLGNNESADNRVFTSGIIGNYFANLMKVNNGKIKKIKTPRDKNPINSVLSVTSVDRFLKQLERLKKLLDQSRTVNLSKIKTSIALSRFIKLRLGDTLRFVVYHIDRHLLQAERTALIGQPATPVGIPLGPSGNTITGIKPSVMSAAGNAGHG